MVLIRVDANEIIGTGHIMRCLSIAHAFAFGKEKVKFITADHRGDVLIKDYEIICLNTEWQKMETEIEKMIGLLESLNPSILLIDSYYVTENYFNILGKKVNIVYIDDMKQKYWNANVIINYNLYSTALDYSEYKKRGIKLILGTQYAPLRDEFIDMPRHFIKNKVTDVLVSAGGADPEGITLQVINEICPKWSGVSFHFIVGALNPRRSQIEQLAKSNKNAVLHINECQMSQLMSICDIAISAAGTTLYELCASGIPTIAYVLADNQITLAEWFEKQQIALKAGDYRNDNSFMYRVEKCMERLICDKKIRKKLSKNMQGLVDGKGAYRIVSLLT